MHEYTSMESTSCIEKPLLNVYAFLSAPLNSKVDTVRERIREIKLKHTHNLSTHTHNYIIHNYDYDMHSKRTL